MPTPSPTASGCQAGNRVPVGAPEVIGRVAGAGEAMALTFDMGGRLDPALDIMAFLVENQVCTTLFPTGAMSATPTGQAVLAIVADHPDLFEVGNHTMHHCHLRNGGLGSPTTAPCRTNGPPDQTFVAAELTDAAAILEAGSGQDPVPYWRPPYGAYTDAVLATAASLGYTKTIMWTLDSLDWRPLAEGGPTAEQIAATVVTSSGSGSVILFHLGGYETLDALRILVPVLRERGLLLTTISDLLS
jgi:peptidoglycan/xylan/chitin deacetylase (PgdA/CDA1 family)